MDGVSKTGNWKPQVSRNVGDSKNDKRMRIVRVVARVFQRGGGGGHTWYIPCMDHIWFIPLLSLVYQWTY